MGTLETFIRNNRERFDDAEPRAGHAARFEEMLRGQDANVISISRSRTWMRVAAVAVVLVTAGLIGFDLLSGRAFSRGGNNLASVTYTQDTREALDYYSKVTTDRMNEIDRIATDCPQGQQLKTKAVNEMAAFDANHDELAKALKENPGNERMEAAMITNQKLKEEALNNIILQGNMEHCNRK
jgi:hypothetical protein